MSEADWEVPKAKARRVKRKNVTAGDGWTVVTHSESHAAPAASGNPALEDAWPKRTVEGLTVARLLEDLIKRQSKWEDTQCAKQLEVILRRKQWDVTEAVCVGIGSFSLDWEHRHRSMWQLVLFLAVINLVAPSSHQLKFFAQEPAFTTLDVDFLSALSITTLATDIESHITDRSFVFAPFVDWDLLLPTFLKDRKPELYIGNAILDNYGLYARTEAKRRVKNDCEAIAQGFLKDRQSVNVSGFSLHTHALNGLVIIYKLRLDEQNE